MRLLGYCLTRLGPVALAVVIGLVLVAPVAAHDRSSDRPHTRTLWAYMTGAQEVPGPGDPDGKGGARITLLPGYGTICFAIRVKDITLPATAAHIHAGARGIAGPVVVALDAPAANGRAKGCVTGVDPDLIRDIGTNPRSYYVNVHTSEFPDGAIRGQLPRNNGHKH
jgi:hypothetical protein